MLRMRTVAGEDVQLHALVVNSEEVTLLFEPLSCDAADNPDEVVVGQPAAVPVAEKVYTCPARRPGIASPSRERRRRPTPFRSLTV